MAGEILIVTDRVGTVVFAAAAEGGVPELDLAALPGRPLSVIVPDAAWCAAPGAPGAGGRVRIVAGRIAIDADAEVSALHAGQPLVTIWLRPVDASVSIRASRHYESVGYLASGIAHGFNNLLTAVLGNLRLAVDQLPGDSPARVPVEDAVQAAERAAELNRQLLLLSVGGSCGREHVLLHDLVIETGKLLSTTISSKIQIRLDVDSDLPAVLGDPGQLRHAVVAAMMNGAHAIGDKAGTLIVRASAIELDADSIAANFPGEPLAPGIGVLFEVRDTGSGVDGSSGLDGVRATIRDHGGAFALESAPGQGTTLRLVLPAAADALPAPAPKRSVPPRASASSAGTILVVDDEALVLRLARSILTRAGYSVLTAPSAEEAVELFAAGSAEISLVILDLTMTGVSGEEVLVQLRAINPHLPVTISSGYAEHEVMARMAPFDLISFLQKPFTKAQLLDRVTAAIGVAASA